jgi:hypothetical protein
VTKSAASPLVRLFAHFASIILCFALLTVFLSPAAIAQVPPSGPKIWLQANQPLPVQHVAAGAGQGATTDLQGLGQGQPVSMAAADLDADGFQDLVVGYSAGGGGFISVHRGNIDAFAPQSDESFQAIGRGEFPSPFQLEAQTFAVPVRPDFIVLGDFLGTSNQDLAIAAKGGNTLYLFPGDGKGNFGTPQTFALPGGVNALAAGRFGGAHQPTLVVGLSGGKNFSLALYAPSAQGFTSLGVLSLSGAASNIQFGDFGDSGMDVAFLSGGKLQILRPNLKLTTVSAGAPVSGFALGSFVYDRTGGLQIAALTGNGSVQVLARNDFDPRVYTVSEFQAIRSAKINHLPPPAFVPLHSFPTGWQTIESFPGVGSIGSNQTPVFFQARVSSNGADDIMWLNAGSGQMAVISHADGQPGAQAFAPGQVSVKPYNGSPVGALPLRINVDGRPGILAIHSGEVAPSMLMPIPDPTFTVDDHTDELVANACSTPIAGKCSLREAVVEANAIAGTDTIMVPAGTWALTIGRSVPAPGTPPEDAKTGTLNINDSVNIVGAGQNSTIITWGTPTSGTVDMAISVNEDITNITSATANISNLTIQNAVNHGGQGNDGDGGCMEFDTGTNGTATLSLTNVTLQNCSTLQGGGGGLVIFNFVTPAGGGGATISNSIIQGNSVVASGQAGNGGGIAIAQDGHMTMTASQVLNNSAVQNCTPTCGLGAGGGVLAFFPQNVSAATGESFIHSSTISGNKSAGFGGGINTSASISIDQGTVISGNIAGTDGSNNTAHASQEGGGLYLNPVLSCPLASTCTATLSKVTITGNTATGNGGGLSYGNASAGTVGALSMSFSRLAGNTTSGGSGSNLSNNHGTATVANNWWGTNSASSTINTISGTTTFDPFIVLTHTGNPQKIRINQSSTLTGNMSADNHGTAVGLANLTEIIGLPITFDAPVLGTIPQAQPETLNASAQATATFNAGGTAGFGTANATVDQAVVPVNSNLIATATESSTTATITTVGAHGYTTGEFVRISGVGVAGYNSSPATQVFAILSTPTATTFTYTANSAGLGASSGGTANASIVILEPPSITKTFSPKTIQTTAGAGTKVSTITFSITNANVVPIDSSFTDSLPSNVGVVPGSLVVASTPSVVNNCGGSVTATAGSGTISFANASLPVGTCTVMVNVQSAVDNIYSNSVTIDSTDAGNGNTSSDTLNVINPPQVVKTFGAASIPFGATTSLTITVSNPNQNQTLSTISFNDTLPNAAPGTLVVATPSGLTNNCTGTATATAGSGSVSLSSSSLAPGASCAVAANVQGTAVGAANNSVTASDTTAGTGNTSTAPETIVKADTTTTVTSSANPSVFGQSVTFTATVSPVAPGAGTPTGTVTFLDGGSPIGTGTLSGGIATFTTSALAVGNHTITTSYGGDTDFNGSTGSLTGNPQVVNKANTATTVTSSVNPSVFGQSVTFTATVSPVAPGSGTSTGTVTFLDGGSPIGSGTLIGGVATFTTSALAVGNHTITTNYGGDGNFNGSTGSLTGNPQVVNKANTATTVTSSLNPSVFGQSVTFTATVSPVAPGSGTPTGTVTFLDGGSPIGTGTLSGGVATFTTSALAVGNHTITTSYGGDGNFNGSTGSLTGNPQVVSKADTTTAVTSSLNPSVFGQSVTFTATVSPVAPGSGTPTGTVTFLDGGSPIGTGTLSGGVATFTTSALAVGNHTITTSYGGDGNFNGSTGSLTGNPQVVNKANTTTAVTSSVNPSVFGQSVTFTATVSAVAPGAGTPTGTVTFLDGGSPIGTGTLSGGIATFTTSALAVGNHTITTSYGGDGNFNGSTGSLTGNPQVVNKSDTTTAVTSSANPSVFGQSVTFTATVAAVAPGSGTPTGTVTFLDGGSPIGTGTLSGGIATFTTSALAIGNHTITTSYGGDGNFNGSTGSLTGNPQVVNKANTTTTVTSSQNPSASGQSVTFTATVSAVAPGSGTPTGTVTFLDGGSPIGTGTLSGGVAIFTTSALAPGNHTITTSYGGDGNFNGSTGSLTGNPQVVLGPPSIAKAFNPSTIALNATTSLTFTITNPAVNTAALTGVAFTDSLPTGLTVASATATVCGGTLNTTNPTGISLTGATIAANSQCQFSVTVTGTASGSYTNTTGPVSSTNGGTGNTATANLTVASAPTITKSFNPTQIALNGNSTLSFSITNPNASVALTGIAFTDNLPAGLVVATPNGLTGSCGGGTITATAGSGAISLSGASLAATASCSFSVNVTGTTAGVKTNSVQVTSTTGGIGNTSTATITVVGPPVIIKAFGAASIPLSGSTSLTFTIQNNNSTASLSGIGFTDTLPAGLIISTPNGLTGSCGGGTITATAGTNTISLSGATLALSTSCTFSINVTGTAAGTQNNTTSQVTSTEGGTGGTASASIAVVAPPSIAKAFNPASIPVNGVSTMTITITNPAANTVSESGVAFTDNFPAGLVVATPNGLSNTCGGTATATAGSGTVSLTGGTIPTSSSCTVAVNVTASVSGSFVNTTGNVTSTNGGTGNTATATLGAASPPTISKAFGASAVGLNSTVGVSFTIVNPNASTTLTGISFTDSLPAGLIVATPNGITNDCGGTVTAVAGSSSISLTGGAIDPGGPPPISPFHRAATAPRRNSLTSNAAGFCVVTVNLQVTTPGTKNNTTGPVSANESGPGNPSNTATLEVIQAPTVSKIFGAASIPLGGTTSLTFNFANPNTTTSLVNVSLNDTLPSGLVVASPNGLVDGCSSSTTAAPGSSSINITNIVLAGGASCTLSVNVTGTSGGTKTNTTSAVTATFDDGSGTFRPITGGTASASIAVVAPPAIAKVFNPASIAPTGISTLSFTITNPAANSVAETGVAFTDTLPANVVVATPNGLTDSCGGTATATAGTAVISLTGGTVAAAASCVVSVNVTSATPGVYTNTSGAVSSTNGGTGNTTTAVLTVATANLSITKTHVGAFPRNSTGNNYTITVSNAAGAGPTLGTVTVTDTLPNVPNTLVATALSGSGWSCTLATLTCTRSDVLAPGSSYPAITLTVTVPLNIQSNVTNSATVSGGGDPNSHTANDPTHIGPPLIITSMDSGSATITHGSPASFLFKVDASGVVPLPAVVSFTCSGLPKGTACIFTQTGTGAPAFAVGYSAANPTSQITLTITSLGNSAHVPAGSRGLPPTYAALLFPVMGLVGVGLAGRKRKQLRFRLAMLVMGLLMLAALAGCGGNALVTPSGQSTVTVTGTVDGAAGVSGSTTITLSVQ